MAVEVELMLLAIPLFSGNGIWKMQPELNMCKMWGNVGKKTKTLVEVTLRGFPVPGAKSPLLLYFEAQIGLTA